MYEPGTLGENSIISAPSFNEVTCKGNSCPSGLVAVTSKSAIPASDLITTKLN